MANTQLDDYLQAELKRQQTGLELIPSENYVSHDVLRALGSVYTNKYSEGYPGKRYYGGQANMDIVERDGIELAKKLFKSGHANLQPHSGAPANQAVYFAWLEPGDKVLAMDLSHGGHLTHGHPVTVTAKLFEFIRYKMKDVETGELDYEEMRKLAHEHKPKIILAGFSSYPRELDYQRFAQIAGEVGAMAMADIAHIAGLIAAGELANPLEHGFQVVTTTTHKTLRGPRGGMILTSGQAGNPLKSIDKSLDNLPTLIDRAVFPGLQGGPHMNNILAKTVALQEASTDEFKQYASQTIKNAKRLAGALMNRGFKLVTNGTDNHLVLADVKQSHGIDGKIAEETLDKIGLTLNKNVVPDDKLPPYAPSGIRLGTPAMTTRGLNEDDMERVAEWMKQALEGRQNEPLLADLKRQVVDFSQDFPLPS
ncbi:MAG TPA: serine hydroxymethyltransferase [Candidatus Saccharimonadales bacterium]|jgi:glycine hydroxymethyltransferase